MMSNIQLLQDLAVMMVLAGVASVLFGRIGIPKVIGYILAGVLMGPHTWGGSFLMSLENAQTIGQLGVIFLMFTLGLEFSTSEMKKIKNVALPTAILDTIVMTWLGYTVGTRFLGWRPIPALFLGAAICDSSTTLLAKVIDELKWSARPFAKYVVGTSVCEDIICVGIIALITGVANGAGMSFGAVGLSLGGLLVFFIATVVFGLILVPRLLSSVAKRHDDEALLLTLLGCCFFITYIAYRLDYSVALGAFLVGILGASSDVRDRLHRLVDPLRSMFSAVFFVSIGLLVNPSACFDNWQTILLLSLVVMAGKCVNCFVGALVTGESLKTCVQFSFGLAQIGEFAYMVALLYVSLSRDVLSPMYQIVVGVSLLTTVLNPIMLRISDPVGEFVERHCPRRLRNWLESYRGFVVKLRDNFVAGDKHGKIVRRAVIQLCVIAVLEFAVVTTFAFLSKFDYSAYWPFFERYDKILFCFIANLFMFGAYTIVHRIALRLASALAEMLVGNGDAGWQVATRPIVRLLAYALVATLFFLECSMLNVNIAPADVWVRYTLLVILIVLLIIGWHRFTRIGKRALDRFEEAITVDERLALLPKELVVLVPENTVHELVLPATSPAIGGTVVTLNIRAKTGASIVSVVRNGEITRNIGPEWEFQVGDKLIALGDGSQIAALKDLLGVTA